MEEMTPNQNLLAEKSEVPFFSGAEDKKIKNFYSLVILLTGLFVGSLFVDVVQLLSGRGFSPRALQSASVLESQGKTWVAFDEPLVGVKVFSKENCEACKTDDVLVWLRRVVPTISAEKIDVTAPAGKALAEQYGIMSIPSFVFAPEIEKSEFYTKAQPVFTKVDESYLLNNSDIGIPVGEYLAAPKIEAQNAAVGKEDALVKLVEFSDFQCPYCKQLHDSVKQILAEKGEQVYFVFKNLPLDIHPQAENAALAAACANEQGKFLDYSDKLFASQSEWGKSNGTAKFKAYAGQLGLATAQFGKCLDDKKYADLIAADKAEAEKYLITGTPAIFVNSQFRNGAVQYEDLKSMIEAELQQ